MATIKVECGLNNPMSSQSREFEINSLGTDINEFDEDTIAYNAALLGIVGLCDSIYYCCTEHVGNTIVIAPSYIKDECVSMIKLIKYVKKYKHDAFNDVLESQLYLLRLANNYFYKTELERAYLAEKYTDFESVVKKTRETALRYISSVFLDGIATISNAENNKLIYVPKSTLLSVLSISEDELYYGVKLRCADRELIIISQDFRNIPVDMMLATKVSSYGDEDDYEVILTNAVTKGIVTAMLYDAETL